MADPLEQLFLGAGFRQELNPVQALEGVFDPASYLLTVSPQLVIVGARISFLNAPDFRVDLHLAEPHNYRNAHIGYVRRVHSLNSLQRSLPSIVTDLQGHAAQGTPIQCPSCGSWLTLKEAIPGGKRFRPFLGCPSFPKCRGTRNPSDALVVYP